MKIKSSAFEENMLIPPIYTCDGDNINPPLNISEVPSNAKSLVLMLVDPDAPNGTFLHWMMWNIPPQTQRIGENDFPQSAEQGENGAGQPGYLGPCPPSGVHHYHFKLYALNKRLDVTPNISKEGLEKEIEDSLIEKTTLTGLYTKQH